MRSRPSQLRVPYAGTREWPFRPSRFHFPSAGFRVCATTSGVCSTGTEHRASRLLNKRSSNRVPSLVHVFLCKLKVRKVFLNFLSSQVIIFFCLIPFPPSSLSFFSSAPLPPCLFPFPSSLPNLPLSVPGHLCNQENPSSFATAAWQRQCLSVSVLKHSAK